MFSIGQRLREERLRKGLQLSDIAAQTRIRVPFLEAIEADQFDIFPGRFFARSFTRQYAQVLGVDDPELEQEIRRQLGEPGPVVSAEQVLARMAESRAEKAPVLWRSRPSGRSLAYATAGMLAVAVILGVYLGWRQVQVRAEVERSTQSPAAEASAPEPSPAPPSPAVQPAPSVVSPAPAVQESKAAAPEAPIVAEIAAARPSWIQVTADGKTLFADTLQAGQSRSFQASQTIRILTGNAGALEIRRNGRPIGPIGPEGQIRTIELTREGHTIGAPKPRTQEPEVSEETAGAPPAP